MSKDELIQLLRVIECFRELEPFESAQKEKDLAGKGLLGGARAKSRSVSPHMKKDSYRQGLRLKQEQEFLNNLWNQVICPFNPLEVQFELVNEAFKVLFNHYIPGPKQADLLYELQLLALQLGQSLTKSQPPLTREEIEDKVVKRLQALYPHYFDLTNIGRVANQEKILNSIKDHYKEFTFKPKINPESANLDLHNISQVYAKLQQEKDRQEVRLRQASRKGEPDIEVVEPGLSDEEDGQRLNAKNLYKFNSLLSQYLQEYKASEISNKEAGHHGKNKSQISAFTDQQSVKTATLVHSGNDGKSRAQTPRNDVSKQDKSRTPERVFRFDYWYIQEKLKQDKIKKQIEDKLRADL